MNRAIKGDNAAVRQLALLEIHDGAAYDHGAVLVELISLIGEERFISSLDTINDKHKKWIAGYIDAGLEYGNNPDIQCRTIKEVFPILNDYLVQDNGKTLTLIICASGDTRAHIISIDSTYSLSYKVGSFLSKDDSYTITYNTDYKEIKRSIPDKDAKKLMELSIDEDALAFNDSSIVKDGWDYCLLVNGERTAYGSSNHFEVYPEKLKQIITLILDNTGELYVLPGLS